MSLLLPLAVACGGTGSGETPDGATRSTGDGSRQDAARGDALLDSGHLHDGRTDATRAGDAFVDAVVGSSDGKADALDGAPAPSEAATDSTPCATALIGPAGGTVFHPSGARIVVPVGALSTATELSLCPEVTSVSGAVGQAFEASPEGQTFLAPVQVVLPFDPTRVSAGASLGSVQMRLAPHGSSAFAALQSSVNLETGLVTASTTHFTNFVPAQTPTPVFITSSPSLPSGTVGITYSQQLSATGGVPPYAWTVPPSTSLPPGLSLGAAGLLSGVPTVPNNFAFFVAVSDSDGDAVEMAVSLTVAPPNNPVPTLTQVTPASVPQGSGDTVIALTGTGFAPTAQALWDGAPLPTAFVGATSVSASIPAANLLNAGSHQISLSNPAPGGGLSGTIMFTVTPAVVNPVPGIVSVTPTQLPISSVDVQVSITGSNFITTSSAAIGSQGISTSYSSPTALLAAVPAAYLSTAGTLPIRVFNPAPGGGYSPTSVLVTVGALHPTPVLTGRSPSAVGAGSAAFTLTLSGSGFVAGAQVFFGSTALATTYESATTVEAAVPAYLVAAAGTGSIVLVNPVPGGGASNQLTLAVVENTADAGGDGSTEAGGACSAVAPSTAQSIGGRCLVTLASGQNAPISFAIDTSNVYWTDCYGGTPGEGTIETVSLQGGVISTLATGQDFPIGIAVDATSVYWTNSANPTGTVMTTPLVGGALTTLVANQVWPTPIAVAGGTVYFGNDTEVLTLPTAGGTPMTLASGYAYDIVVDATDMYWADGSAVIRQPLAGGSPTTLYSASYGIGWIALDSSNVYWTNEGMGNGVLDGSVMSVSINGGAPTTLATGQNQPRGVAVDPSSVYWTSYCGPGAECWAAGGGGSVFKVPIGGGTITTLVTGQDQPLEVAVDATSVYWNNYTNTGGSIMRLTPK